MIELKKKYLKEIVPALKEKLQLGNDLAVPRMEKVVVNSGTGQALKDAKLLDVVTKNITDITGQKPILTKAKKSISNFKIRKGMVVGVKVTLRGERMYDFVSKLVNNALPREKDFRGLPGSGFDGKGNFTLGVKEQTIFPEINPSEIDKIHGFDITMVTTAKDDKSGKALLSYLGFPFQEK